MEPKEGSERPADQRPQIGRWTFLEDESDACAVLSRKMEILYLNEAARPLVPPDWMGRRCWETFPVGESSCASRCPAVRAVQAADDIVYCEEFLYPGGDRLSLGVAIIPLDPARGDRGRAVVLLRPGSPAPGNRCFREECLTRARKLRERIRSSDRRRGV